MKKNIEHKDLKPIYLGYKFSKDIVEDYLYNFKNNTLEDYVFGSLLPYAIEKLVEATESQEETIKDYNYNLKTKFEIGDTISYMQKVGKDENKISLNTVYKKEICKIDKIQYTKTNEFKKFKIRYILSNCRIIEEDELIKSGAVKDENIDIRT